MESTHIAPPPAGAAPFGATLRRSTSDRLLLGLCAGIARATNTNPTTVRLATVVVGVVFLPAVVLAYLVTAAILPRDDGAALVGSGTRDRRDVVTALILTFVGAPLVIGAGAEWGLTSGPLVWPLLVLGAGAALAVAIYKPEHQVARAWNASATQPPAQSPAPETTGFAFPAATAAPEVHHATSSEATGVDADADANESGDAAEAPTTVGNGNDAPPPPTGDPISTAVHPGQPGYASPPPPPPPGGPTFLKPGDGPPRPPEPPRRGLALPVICAMALVPAIFAVLFAVGAIDGGWQTWAIMLAVLATVAALGAVAIALLRPSYLGAALLVILAAMLGVSSIALSQIGPALDEGVGERTFRPQTPREIQPVYEHGAGRLNVDLRDLELRRGSRTVVRAEIGFGEIVVAVPRGVRVVAAPDSSLTGLTTSARRNGANAATSASAPTIILDAQARAGEVRLVSGTSPDIDDLEILAQDDTGFWDPNNDADRFDRYRNGIGATTP